MHTITTLFVSLIVLACCILYPATQSFSQPAAPADEGFPAPAYKLSITFRPEEHQLIGTAVLEIPAKERLNLNLTGLQVTGGLLQSESGGENELTDLKDIFILPPTHEARTLYLSYTAQFTGTGDNVIEKDHITLGGIWHPLPDYRMQFQLSVSLPPDFVPITESDNFPPNKNKGIFSTQFSHPVTNIHFMAAPYEVQQLPVRDTLSVFTAFFPEDKDLAQDYLTAARNFIVMYEEKIGPFPYDHFLIVANRQPTGYSIPTMTLLGQTVLRLPFIKETSLGHEIVHSWFGNSVEVNYAEGNWCEALTAFLSDHRFRELAGEGPDDRKETITKYLNSVNATGAIPLNQFRSASHSQTMANARRAVGYDRGAMFFNELRYRIGPEDFSRGVKRFYRDNKNKIAGWTDLQKSFELESQENLKEFFHNRLSRQDIPEVLLSAASITETVDTYVLSLELKQSTPAYDLVLPVQVQTMSGIVSRDIVLQQSSATVEIELDNRPLSVRIDPGYQLLRRLSPSEKPAVWSGILGSQNRLIIAPETQDTDRYTPLLQVLDAQPDEIRKDSTIQQADLVNHDLVFLGTDSTTLHEMFGTVSVPPDFFVVEVHKNPFNPEKLAAIISSDSLADSELLSGRLRHYGKYSRLHFDHGRNILKNIEQTETGIFRELEKLPAGLPATAISSFAQIVSQLDTAKVIYVGENHTAAADHRLQLRIIEALYQTDKKLAIGMEMFPTSAQDALDAYTRVEPKTDERTFLQQSGYFDVWGYDFRFYRDILKFARQHNLPVKGLNLDRDIVSEVFKSGGTSSLSPDVKQSLPATRDLSLAGYSEQLRMIFAAHADIGHGSGEISGFIQAQALWDETMAENIVRFLQAHPDYRMVVLGGNQHTRKDFGIPPRVARRLPVPQISIINISSDPGSGSLADIADFVFTAEPFELPEQPRMGLILSPGEYQGNKIIKIAELAPHSKAKEADLQPEDIIESINGIKVNSMSDVKIAMVDCQSGDVVGVRVLRKTATSWDKLTREVTLTIPPAAPMHSR